MSCCIVIQPRIHDSCQIDVAAISRGSIRHVNKPMHRVDQIMLRRNSLFSSFFFVLSCMTTVERYLLTFCSYHRDSQKKECSIVSSFTHFQPFFIVLFIIYSFVVSFRFRSTPFRAYLQTQRFSMLLASVYITKLNDRHVIACTTQDYPYFREKGDEILRAGGDFTRFVSSENVNSVSENREISFFIAAFNFFLRVDRFTDQKWPLH